MSSDLRKLAQRGNAAVPSFFKPSPWMWENPNDPRPHSCFANWLRANKDRLVADWTLYECEHYA